jgi:outer membrane protein assembly factor BamD
MSKSALLPVFALVCLLACSGKQRLGDMPPADRLEAADDLKARGRCTKAIEQYEKVISGFPAQEIVERARFNLATCRLELRQYDVARSEFESFVDTYPRSDLVDNALYMIALTYLEESPRAERDQTATRSALRELELLVREYPDSDVRESADQAILRCRAKLAEKDYLTGALYLRLRDYSAARIYFDLVASNYPDTEWAPRALLGKATAYRRQGRREEARQVYEQVLGDYPGTPASEAASSRLRGLRLEGEESQAASEE